MTTFIDWTEIFKYFGEHVIDVIVALGTTSTAIGVGVMNVRRLNVETLHIGSVEDAQLIKDKADEAASKVDPNSLTIGVVTDNFISMYR